MWLCRTLSGALGLALALAGHVAAQGDGGVKIVKLSADDRLPRDPAGTMLDNYLEIRLNHVQVLGTHQSYHLPLVPPLLV